MRVGIFYEHQLPRPWAPGDEHRLLADALEQVKLADRLGIDYLWEAERHLPRASSACPRYITHLRQSATLPRPWGLPIYYLVFLVALCPMRLARSAAVAAVIGAGGGRRRRASRIGGISSTAAPAALAGAPGRGWGGAPSSRAGARSGVFHGWRRMVTSSRSDSDRGPRRRMRCRAR